MTAQVQVYDRVGMWEGPALNVVGDLRIEFVTETWGAQCKNRFYSEECIQETMRN